MSEAARLLVGEPQALLVRVEALRGHASAAHAGQRPDPMRLRYIEALARRLQAAPPAVQKVLQAKLEEALNAVGGGAEAAAPAGQVKPAEGLTGHSLPGKPRANSPPNTGAAPPLAPLSRLGQLNQHIHTAAQTSGTGEPSQATAPQDLKSALRFRETWARISAETEVDQATHRAPENAGPLNAHNLVLRTLGLMRELSPDYLRRFMDHTESLLWLDQAHGQLKQPVGKTKAAKTTKPRA